jgi:hypothetical protein
MVIPKRPEIELYNEFGRLITKHNYDPRLTELQKYRLNQWFNDSLKVKPLIGFGFKVSFIKNLLIKIKKAFKSWVL